MFDYNKLIELEKQNIEDTSKLKELNDIIINPNQPIEERFEAFLNQINNPYHFLVNDIPVKISFNDHNKKTLDSCLIDYLTCKK